jgi:hypothetical protein
LVGKFTIKTVMKTMELQLEDLHSINKITHEDISRLGKFNKNNGHNPKMPKLHMYLNKL